MYIGNDRIFFHKVSQYIDVVGIDAYFSLTDGPCAAKNWFDMVTLLIIFA
jgi:hypothetical protein